MTINVHVLNGPNLDLLGVREPDIYGATTLDQIRTMVMDVARGPVTFHQTNHEGQLIDQVQEIACMGSDHGIIINPAGLTFRSVALVDALKMVEGPIIELHISNIHARSSIYHHSLVSPIATAVIAGLGARGYAVAMDAIYGIVKK